MSSKRFGDADHLSRSVATLAECMID
jgi:hypothetical protein